MTINRWQKRLRNSCKRTASTSRSLRPGTRRSKSLRRSNRRSCCAINDCPTSRGLKSLGHCVAGRAVLMRSKWKSRWRTREKGFTPSFCRSCSHASLRKTVPRPAPMSVWVWASPSFGSWWRNTAGRSGLSAPVKARDPCLRSRSRARAVINARSRQQVRSSPRPPSRSSHSPSI